MTDPNRRAGFESLVRQVADPVRGYLLRRTDAATADDVLAETLLVLWRRQRDVPEEAVPWAIGIARLQLRNAERAVRRQSRLVAKIAVVDPPHEDGGGDPADRAASDGGDGSGGGASSDGAEVRRVIAGLRPADAEVLRLWAWDDLAAADIAQVLGITANAAAVRLHRARARFAQRWGNREHGDGHVGMSERARS